MRLPVEPVCAVGWASGPSSMFVMEKIMVGQGPPYADAMRTVGSIVTALAESSPKNCTW
jgi:hypothetical protein